MDPMTQYSLFEAGEADLPWSDIVIPAALEAVGRDHGRLVIMNGHRGLFPLGHYLTVWRLIEEEAVIFVDGANHFDLPMIARLARRLKKDARGFLERIHLSRAFTVHQLEAVIHEHLEDALQKHRSRLCLISGLLDTFSDEEVPLWEAKGILSRVMERLRLLADQGYRVVVLAPDPPVPVPQRNGLASFITKKADRVFRLSEQSGEFMLRDETKTARGKQWPLPALPLFRKREISR